MKPVSTTLVIPAVLALLALCGGLPGLSPAADATVTSEEGLEARHDDPHGTGRGDDCMPRADFDEVSPRMAAQLNVARHAGCKFRRVEDALDARDGNLNSPEWVAPLEGVPIPPTSAGKCTPTTTSACGSSTSGPRPASSRTSTRT